jgi:hypothetical protein
MKKTNSYLTILSIVFGFLIINLFVNSDYLNYFIIIISGLALLSTAISENIELIWMKIGVILSKIIPNILLISIFFFVLTPLSFLSKIFKSKTLYNNTNDLNSYFVKITKRFDKKSFEKAW